MTDTRTNEDQDAIRARMAALVESTANAIADIRVGHCIHRLRDVRPHLVALAADGAGPAMAMLLTELELHMKMMRSDAGRPPS